MTNAELFRKVAERRMSPEQAAGVMLRRDNQRPRFLRWLLLLLSGALLFGSVAFAQDGELIVVPEPPEMPPGEDQIEHLELRQPAPYAGMLLDTDTSIRWTFTLEWYRNELGLTLRAHRRELLAIAGSHERELTLVRTSYDREIEGLRTDLREQAQTLARAAEQPFYDTFAFGAVIGIVLAGVLVGLVAWAANEI